MYQENQNSSSTKSEDVTGDNVNKSSKPNPFGHLSSNSTDQKSTGDNDSDNSENNPMIQSLI